MDAGNRGFVNIFETGGFFYFIVILLYLASHVYMKMKTSTYCVKLHVDMCVVCL